MTGIYRKKSAKKQKKIKKLEAKKKLIKELAILMIARHHLQSVIIKYIDNKGIIKSNLKEEERNLLLIDKRLHFILNNYKEDYLTLAVTEGNKAIRGLGNPQKVNHGTFALAILSCYYDFFEHKKINLGLKNMLFETIDALTNKYKERNKKEELKFMRDSYDMAEALIKRLIKQS